jgi:hypothetical protein
MDSTDSGRAAGAFATTSSARRSFSTTAVCDEKAPTTENQLSGSSRSKTVNGERQYGDYLLRAAAGHDPPGGVRQAPREHVQRVEGEPLQARVVVRQLPAQGEEVQVSSCLGFMQSAQGKVLDPASKVGEVRGHGDQLQVVDALADRHLELMGLHQPGKGAARSLPLRGLRQKVRVPGEEDAPEHGGPVQKLRVGVHIHVEANAQESRPRALSRAARGESPASFSS